MAGITVSSNKRIAKNTFVLYLRMIFLMVVSLYTSRVTLSALGETDYGLYNVVGGIVVILSFLNNAMASATQRFLNYEMGKNNNAGLQRVFSTAIRIHAYVAVAILLLAETVGLWFLNSQMNIPADRMVAANWVYQFSVGSFLASVLCVPFNASIIAHEKMSAFAYISIFEALAKLSIVFLIQVTMFDRLIFYAFLLFLVGITLCIIYSSYCRRKFVECHYKNNLVDKSLSKEMLSFSSWTIFGNLGYILHTQGIAICINIFFGAAVNAAQGISNAVNSAVSGFVTNFQIALNPQIVKSYAAGQLEEMHNLIYRGCRFSFYLISLFAIPLIIEAPAVIGFWLEEVPEYTVIFVRLILLISIVNSYSSIFATSQGATGKVKVYQIVLTTVGALHVPLTLLAFYLGFLPYSCSWIYLALVIVLQIIRICFVSRSTKMPLLIFANKVIKPCVIVFAIAFIVPTIIHKVWFGGFWVLAAKCVISCSLTAVLVYFIGIEANERKILLDVAKKIKNKLLNNRNNL